MKSIHLNGLLLCCILYFPSLAQLTIPITRQTQEKSLLFTPLSEKTSISIETLEGLFNGKSSGMVLIALAGGNQLEGAILEKVAKSATLETINIRLSNYSGSMFTLSKIKNSDLSYSYAGRIVSRAHGDVLVLSRVKDKYFLVKQKQSLYLVE